MEVEAEVEAEAVGLLPPQRAADGVIRFTIRDDGFESQRFRRCGIYFCIYFWERRHIRTDHNTPAAQEAEPPDRFSLTNSSGIPALRR